MAPSAGHVEGVALASRPPQPRAFRVERERGEIRLAGDLRLAHAAEIWAALVAASDSASDEAIADASGELTLDLAGVQAIDGAIMALLVELRTDLATRGVRAELKGTGKRFDRLVDLYGGRGEPVGEAPPPEESVLARTGAAGARMRDELASVFDFIGNVGRAAFDLARHPRLGHWKSIPALAQRSGADALPIVLLINALVGFAMAFQSAKQLELYGANLYVADLVGIATTRELAPLMTAIVVCGRTGAGYAAEIGTMQINEEIDALRTLGLRPFNWLVIPRMIAMLFVLPALTLLGDFVGVAGGMIVAVADLDLTVYGYLLETRAAVAGWDVATGLVKSVVFAVAIVVIAAQQGLAASGGAESVGRRTTSTVVSSLFVLVLLDAILTLIFRIFSI